MIQNSPDITPVMRSVKIYRMLLNGYPAKFQQEYGLQMVLVFQDCCLRALRQGKTNGMVKLWMVTLLDLVQSVIAEHAQKELEMKKEMNPRDIRRSGWALILAAASFVLAILIPGRLGSIGSEIAVLLLVFVSLPLLVFGVLGLRQRYGEKVGSFGKNILLIGVILGPLTSLIGFTLLRVGEYWFITWTGPAVLFTCLTLFGAVALFTRPMRSWNILPIIAGLSYPLLFYSYILNSHWVRVLTSSLIGHWYIIPGIPDGVATILILIQCIALAVLGYTLKSDVPEETAALA